MEYQVIARKWRPQRFEDVVFQDHISKTIKNSIRMGRISHAYLFSGPRGVGKTTMARILAKALNCLSGEGPSDNPCDVCENCVEIRKGYSFDVIEIDGASNRGIDNIRELRENVNLAPVKARFKVYIIDEVHMLTKEAFNALLKTLEEPPKHVVFIFATTEIHRIPETILSRCQKFLFKKIPVEAVANQLEKIVREEGYKIDRGALYPIARAGEGSMRDSQSLLDQVISFSDGSISEEDALSILGIVTLESYLKLLAFISGMDPVKIIEELERISLMGIDIPRYTAGFIDIIRTVRLVNNGIVLTEVLGFSENEMQLLKKIGSNFNDEELSIIYRIGVDLQNNLRFSANERISLEMALLDMISVKKAPSIASILKKISEAGGSENRAVQGTEAVQADKPANKVNSEEAAIDSIKSLFHGEVME